MELRALRMFVEVVKQGGFSAAAKTLFASQSTVSKAVKLLEDEVGASLLDRPGHQIRLTAVGERVHRRAVAMLAEREHLEAEFADLRGLKPRPGQRRESGFSVRAREGRKGARGNLTPRRQVILN